MNKCKIDGCEKDSWCKKLCGTHYSRLRRRGTTDSLHNVKIVCKKRGCRNFAKAKGMCDTHYMKFRRTGTLEKVFGTPEHLSQLAYSKTSELGRIAPHRVPGVRGTYAVRLVNDIKGKARARGMQWELDPIDAYKLISGECNYCGFKPDYPNERIGIDRVENHLGYTKENSVGCCFSCNSAKGEKSLKDFVEWVKSIYKKTVGEISSPSILSLGG